MSEPDQPVNFRVLKPSRPSLAAGDVFAMQTPDQDFLFGRVVIADAPRDKAPMPAANLLYIYRWRAKTMVPDLAQLTPDRLLIPPVWTNRQAWLKGYFQTVEHRPLDAGDRLRRHCFETLRRRPRHVDEQGRPLMFRRDPCGVWALAGYARIDHDISAALGIPQAV